MNALPATVLSRIFRHCPGNLELRLWDGARLRFGELPAAAALTLRHWVRRLEARREDALREVGETVYRVWRLYMAACALQFEQGETGVYQILLARGGESTRGRSIVNRAAPRQEVR